MEVVMAKPLKVQIIERAKELIQDESRWCRGAASFPETSSMP
jgi:hypothetical protein